MRGARTQTRLCIFRQPIAQFIAQMFQEKLLSAGTMATTPPYVRSFGSRFLRPAQPPKRATLRAAKEAGGAALGGAQRVPRRLSTHSLAIPSPRQTLSFSSWLSIVRGRVAVDFRKVNFC